MTKEMERQFNELRMGEDIESDTESLAREQEVELQVLLTPAEYEHIISEKRRRGIAF